MSTLRVSTIQDTAGSNSSTPAAIANGIAKAWVNFNGTGTVAIRAQYNVSSITDNAAGNYTVNFTTALTDANYAAVGTLGQTGSVVILRVTAGSQTTSSCDFLSHNTSNTATDATYVNIAFFR